MTSEDGIVQETIQTPEHLITLEKPLPGPFIGAQEAYGALPAVTAKAREYGGPEYARWQAMRIAAPQLDANRNPLFKGPTRYFSGLEGWYLEYPPQEALKRLAGTGHGINRALDRLNDHTWGTSDRLKRTLRGELFDPQSVVLAEELFMDIKNRLQAYANPNVKQFRKETADYVAQFPNAGVKFVEDATGKLVKNTVTVPIFPQSPGIYERLLITSDMLTPQEWHDLEILVALGSMTHPLCHAMVKRGVLSDELKEALKPTLHAIGDYDPVTPHPYVSLPPEPHHDYPPAPGIIDQSFIDKDPPPPVHYMLKVEDPRAPGVITWQKQCLDSVSAYLNSRLGKQVARLGISSVYSPRVVFSPKDRIYQVVPSTINTGSVIIDNDFPRELACVVQSYKERYISETEEEARRHKKPGDTALSAEERLMAQLNGEQPAGPISHLEIQLRALVSNKITSVIYNGKTYILTEDSIKELAALIPPYTSIAEIAGGRQGVPRTLAAVSGGWNDAKTPLYLGTELTLNAQGVATGTKLFTVPKLKNTMLPQRPKGKN